MPRSSRCCRPSSHRGDTAPRGVVVLVQGITWVRAIAGPPPKRRTDVKNPPIVLPDFVKKDERLQQEELYSDN